MISSTPNFSAVRNGERTRFRRSRIASRCASGSAATSNSLLYATSTPPSIGRLPQSPDGQARSEEHTSELQSLMRISYAVFCLKKKQTNHTNNIQQRHRATNQ